MADGIRSEAQWPWLIRLIYWQKEIDLGILGVWVIRAPIRFAWMTDSKGKST